MVTSDRKAWEQQQRRNRIIDKAEAVFFETGYEGATLPAIADAAGYNKRTLYLYFKDKQEIFLAVVLRGLAALRTALEEAVSRNAPGDNGLRLLADAFFDFSIHSPDYLDLIMIYESRHFVYHDRRPAEDPDSVLEQCQQVSDDMARMVTESIEGGMAAGGIRKDLAPRQLMLVLWGQIFGVMKILRIREKHFRKAFDIDRRALFDQFVVMVERSLAP